MQGAIASKQLIYGESEELRNVQQPLPKRISRAIGDMNASGLIPYALQVDFACTVAQSCGKSSLMLAQKDSLPHRSGAETIDLSTALTLVSSCVSKEVRRLTGKESNDEIVIVTSNSEGRHFLIGINTADQIWKFEASDADLAVIRNNSRLAHPQRVDLGQFTPYSYGKQFQAQLPFKVSSGFKSEKYFCGSRRHFNQLIAGKVFHNAPCILGPICIIPRLEPEHVSKCAILLWGKLIANSIALNEIVDAAGAEAVVESLNTITSLVGLQKSLAENRPASI